MKHKKLVLILVLFALVLWLRETDIQGNALRSRSSTRVTRLRKPLTLRDRVRLLEGKVLQLERQVHSLTYSKVVSGSSNYVTPVSKKNAPSPRDYRSVEQWHRATEIYNRLHSGNEIIQEKGKKPYIR